MKPEEVEEVLEAKEALPWEGGEPEKPVLPEAPTSITIRAYYKGFSVLITRRPADEKVELDKIAQSIDNMIAKGYKASWNDETNGKHETKPDPNSPLCSVHKTPMTWKKPGISKTTNRPYPGFWACNVKNENGEWCNARPEITTT